MLNKFAEELKAARTERNLTLQQIAAKTRIDLKFLEEMEKGNFSFLPELYINAFLKEYVRLVGLDENLMLKKFAAAKSGKEFYEHEEISEDSSLKKQKNEKDMQKERKVSFSAVDATDFQESQERTAAQKQKMIIGIAAAVILIFIIVYFAFIKSNPDIVVSEKPYSEVQQNASEPYAEQPPKTQPADSMQNFSSSSDSLTLYIDASDTSWIKLLLDNSKVEEFTLFPHSTKDIKALKNYKIIVGNSAGMHFRLNNKSLGFSGKKNEVKFISIDSTGLKYLSNQPTFGNQ